MIVYSGIKADFMSSVENDTIAIEVQHTIWTKMGKATPENEFRSWDNSLQHMYKVLNDHNIPCDAGIAIEYNIPQTSKRIDFIISGYDDKNRANAVIIELKQWEKLTAIKNQDCIVETFIGKTDRRVPHECRFTVYWFRKFYQRS